MDLGKLLPLAFKLLGQSERIRQIVHHSEPVADELRKVWPEAAPLIKDIITRCKRLRVLLTPAIKEAQVAWPQLEPLVTDLSKSVWPEFVAQWSKLRESTLPPMSIRWVQENLNALGASPRLQVDGKLGPGTENAIRQYQQRKGIEADGWAGPETLTNMLRDLAS